MRSCHLCSTSCSCCSRQHSFCKLFTQGPRTPLLSSCTALQFSLSSSARDASQMLPMTISPTCQLVLAFRNKIRLSEALMMNFAGFFCKQCHCDRCLFPCVLQSLTATCSNDPVAFSWSVSVNLSCAVFVEDVRLPSNCTLLIF